jgi:glucokinase
MLPLKEVIYQKPLVQPDKLVLAGDIGGTNSNFGFCQVMPDNQIKLLFSLHIKSREIQDFSAAVAQLLDYVQSTHALIVKKACFGAAGVTTDIRTFCKPTNLDFILDSEKICQEADLDYAVIINDFEAIGYGLEKIDPQSLTIINAGNPLPYANKAIIGAGTGLGKGILGWDHENKLYVPIPSEGGHADFPAQSSFDTQLIEYIHSTQSAQCNISCEDILSGKGIQRIYQFLAQHNQVYEPSYYSEKIAENSFNPDQIFAHWQEDKHCYDTYQLYAQYYARITKNFALDSLALAGIYIAGGIAAKNLSLFTQPIFMQEFINCCKQKSLLENIPVIAINDYNISLYGAAAFLVLQKII